MATGNVTSTNPVPVSIAEPFSNGAPTGKGTGGMPARESSQLPRMPPGETGRSARRAAERQQRSADIHVGEPRPTRFKNTPENHERMVRQIKAQQKAHGVEVKMRDATDKLGLAEGSALPESRSQPGPKAVAWLDAAWSKYVPSLLPGAAAASTEVPQESCAIDGTCDLSPANSPATLAGLRHDAQAAGFTFKASASLLSRKDPSLKGVLILIADMDHTDSKLQATIGALIGRHIRPGGFFSKGDKMSVETTPSDSYALVRQWCRGQEPASLFNLYSAPCVGIDSAEEMAKIVDALAQVKKASYALLGAMAEHGDAGAAAALGKGGSAVETDTVLRSASKKVQKAVQSESAAFYDAHDAYLVVVDKSVPARDAHFKARIAESADPNVANFVPLGGTHIANIMDHFLAATDTVVLASRAHLIRNAADKYSRDPQGMWDLKRWDT